MKSPKQNKNTSLEALLASIDERMEKDLLIVPEIRTPKVDDIEPMPTGSKLLNEALDIGGLPRGRIVEITGEEACLDEKTHINFIAWNEKTGKIINSKGGTIAYLYKRFHHLNRLKLCKNAVLTVPSFNEENRIFHNRIHDVVKTGHKDCFEIKTCSGLSLIATNDHKFYTPHGFKKLEHLKNDDVIYVHNNMPYKKNEREKKYYGEVFVKYHPRKRKKLIKDDSVNKTYTFYRVGKSHFIFEAEMNNLTPKQYKYLLNTASAEFLNKLWVIPKGFEIHHIDENSCNNTLNNLLLLKRGEHQRYHALRNHNALRFMLTKDKILSIKKVGKRMTYDIKCFSPYNHYIANKFAVHNSGKTTLCLSIIANAQARDLKCAYIDTEHAIDRKRAETLGVQMDKLALSQPSFAEQALDLLSLLVDSKVFTVIVLDSVAALVPKAELEGEMQDAVIGLQARLMGKALRKITASASKNKVLVIFTNQLRDKVGGFLPIPIKVGSGGNALKFYASVRLDMRRTKNEMKGERLVLTHHKITVRKNKVGVPFRVVQVKIGENGFVNEETI